MDPTTERDLRDDVRDLEQAYGGTFERTPYSGGVRVRLRRPDDEAIAATGPTTAAAVAALAKRVHAFLAALGDDQ